MWYFEIDLPRTSPEKKKEYDRKFPWMKKLAPGGDLNNLRLISIAPRETVAALMKKDGKTPSLFCIGEDGFIYRKVGYCRNPSDPSFIQRLFPKLFPYEEWVSVQETLGDVCYWSSAQTAQKVFVITFIVVLWHDELVLYRIPKGYKTFAEFFAKVREDREKEEERLCAIAREEIEREIEQ